MQKQWYEAAQEAVANMKHSCRIFYRLAGLTHMLETIAELDKALPYDGHTAKDVVNRLQKLVGGGDEAIKS